MNLKYSKYIAKYNGVFCAAKKREGVIPMGSVAGAGKAAGLSQIYLR